MNSDAILKTVTKHYVASGDFNGIALEILAEKHDADLTDVISSVRELLLDGKLTLEFGDRHPNPHIKALEEEPIEDQDRKLLLYAAEAYEDAEPPLPIPLPDGNEIVVRVPKRMACAYPSQNHLKKVVRASRYQDRPFTKRLVLGEPQLRFLPFDLRVLEAYRSDPRFKYSCDGLLGTIYVRGEHYEAMRERDRVVVRSFGFAYDAQSNRAVAVVLRYLAALSPEHQQIWNAHLLTEKFQIHEVYWRSAIGGEWLSAVSVFEACAKRLKQLNQMCEIIGRPRLFRNELEVLPNEFGFMIRPTSKEFALFVHTLDKLLSDNINRDFFENEVPYESETTRKDGKVIVQQKGTIQILSDWLDKVYSIADRTPVIEAVDTLRKVRKLRNPNAHKLDDDVFDQDLFRQQIELMKDVYHSLTRLSYVLACHPTIRECGFDDPLEDHTIWLQ